MSSQIQKKCHQLIYLSSVLYGKTSFAYTILNKIQQERNDDIELIIDQQNDCDFKIYRMANVFQLDKNPLYAFMNQIIKKTNKDRRVSFYPRN